MLDDECRGNHALGSSAAVDPAWLRGRKGLPTRLREHRDSMKLTVPNWDAFRDPDAVTGDYVFVPLGTHANKQGRVVGENLADGNASFGGVLGTAITRFVTEGHHVEIARTGLSAAEASAAGLTATGLVTEGRTASGYMPEASPMATKILADPRDRRLLGVQVIGGPGAGKRIDTAAAALWGVMTVDDLAGMDLAYAPPFATVWEAIQLAARRLADRLGKARGPASWHLISGTLVGSNGSDGRTWIRRNLHRLRPPMETSCRRP